MSSDRQTGKRIVLIATAALLLAACGHSSAGNSDGGGGAGGAGSGGTGGGAGGGGGTITQQDVLAACIAALACVEPYSNNGFVDCFADFSQGISILRDADVSCLANANGDCAKARTCLGLTVNQSPCQPQGSTCSGSILNVCNFVQRNFDCRHWYNGAQPPGTTDSTCVTSSTGASACGIGTCAADGVACDGTRIVTCQNGIKFAEDCAVSIGQTCVMGSSGPTCAGTGAACSTARHCEGSTLVDCAGGSEVRTDCNQVFPGSTCQTFVGGTSPQSFCGFGNSCAPGLQMCQGTNTAACLFGVTQVFDCAANGYGACMNGLCIPTTP